MMKYMGSKRSMLQNGLGTLLSKELKSATRFIDLFTGSGAVASYVAQKSKKRVLAFDLQDYSVLLARAALGRTRLVQAEKIWARWAKRAEKKIRNYEPPPLEKITKANVDVSRQWSARRRTLPVTRSYGGHYFSPSQSLWIDGLLATIPRTEPASTLARAALVQAASQCVAAPGHTAQPFQPTLTARKFLAEAWQRDVVVATRLSFLTLSSGRAKRMGKAEVKDANDAARSLRKGDLVFIDPPYSGVHYSRFYHVLETIARGDCGMVSGVGRYPAPDERPWSRYSVSSKASAALDELLQTISRRRAKAILTFPAHKCSNGLSGRSVRRIARKHFRITTERVKSLFSTLGGTGDKESKKPQAKRQARRIAKELMLVLKPKRTR